MGALGIDDVAGCFLAECWVVDGAQAQHVCVAVCDAASFHEGVGEGRVWGLGGVAVVGDMGHGFGIGDWQGASQQVD